ncbi:CMP-N-acetylneuraminic acid synthetase [Methanonatronarchaeum thermophilum]|uniref:N-acylneuraminate cytidylyltransferase n=1 Tax=Methanonatronarchaeum thermophilum TaxID=1927129 RepID=A0A1Y3G9G8_9EURY|nr:acylneuraminate cytidylyltransferase [Methanonatronarchaeum thermophilum]OUJ18092.1 CMP-N-acetylneuraminic acid synthetase [Methanonatronarchaeum thermophilum]
MSSNFEKKNLIGLIPARGGSKGIPEKNIVSLCGLPLIAYTVKASLNSTIDKTIVSTDSNEIAKVAEEFGAEVIKRPDRLATDDAPTEPTIGHSIRELENEDYEFSDIALLQPTSPLRNSIDIDSAYNKYREGGFDSLLSVFENEYFYWDQKGNPINYDFRERPRRQDKDWEYVENGAIYIFSKERFLEHDNRLFGDIGMYVMPRERSIDIDGPLDLKLAEKIILEEKPNMGNHQETLEDLGLVIFDVDGVFTDGSVILNETGDESMKFSRVDGKGIEILKKDGFEVAVVSSEGSGIIEKRMSKLGIDEVHIGIKDKLSVYRDIKDRYGFRDKEICFCGDDIQDIPVMKEVGFSCCPANAQIEVKRISDYISRKKGGDGFVRDIQKTLTK